MTNCIDLYILTVRHDAETARTLADSIRRYRLPSKLQLPDKTLDYRRIQLDCDEAPLDEKTRAQLDHSRFLLLICSPDTKNDPGVLARLAWFRRSHEKEEVIAVIAEGEPIDSFPESFIEKKKVQCILPDMTVVERIDTIEPVAADLRGNTPKRRRELLRYETVRIIASVLGLHPDDLEQRHRTRRRQALIAALSVVAAASLGAAAIFLRLGWIARTEGNIAAEQTRLSVEIAQRTMEELPEAFADDPTALMYIDEAVENAKADLEELGLGDLLAGETES